MKLTFYGAAEEVTGSCTLLEHKDYGLLVDCGAFQGSRGNLIKNRDGFDFDPASIDAVVVTHAHFDHCGRLPKLCAAGYDGPIYCTAATGDLVRLVLEDSLSVMESQYQEEGIPPFFTIEHLQKMVSQLKPVEYGTEVNLGDGIRFRLIDAGHVFGSSSVVAQAGGKTVVFSGDLGNDGSPIIRDTVLPEQADAVIMESTYALREHQLPKERTDKLEAAIKEVYQNKGVLLIPAFAIERTQEVLWELDSLADQGRLPQDLPFYLDSPLAIRVSEVFKRYPKLYDEDARRAFEQHHDFLNFPNLQVMLSSSDSKRINNAPSPKVIIAGAGMMNGGRILFHLQRYLSLPTTTLLIIGYQAEGSLGRQILEGEPMVAVLGKQVKVKAKIIKIDSYSAHADHNKLTEWVSTISPQPEFVFLNHGEKDRSEAFAKMLLEKRGLNAIVPEPGKEYQL